MMRRRNSTSLARSRARAAEEDVNPNAYLTNLTDCMLVMVVGLLIALVAHYGVDLQQEEQPLTGQEVIMDEDDDGLVDEETYEETGKVYRDKETGNYYLVKGK